MILRKTNNININQDIRKESLSNFLKLTDENTIKDNPIIKELEKRGLFQ